MSSSASHDATLDDGQVSNTDKIVGIAIASVAAFLYASGLCVQRAALTVSEPDTVVAGCHGRCCQQHSTLNWAIGLVVYGVGGLFLGTLALRYIPLSLSSSIFSSVLVFNALVARVWLKELVQPVDLLCYILIIAGITVDAYYLPDTPNKIDVHVLEALWKEPIGIAFWVVVLSVLLFLQGLILCRLERKDEVNGGYDGQRVYRLAMISYPVVLGTWEGVAYMCLKAGNDILDHISDGRDDQTEHWLWWLGVSISLPMCIVIVVWVRKSYSRFPTTQIFPLELGGAQLMQLSVFRCLCSSAAVLM